MVTDIIVPLVSLIALEIILGIDNVIFISILSDRLPPKRRKKLRYWGIGLAMLIRLALLALVSWIMKLDKVLFTVFDTGISGKGMILIVGGLFLIYKSSTEILHKTENPADDGVKVPANSTFKNLLIQIILLDLVFSIDSIITAVGMVQELWMMYVAVIVTVVIMLFAAGPISSFIQKHPSFKILALCFLMMIGLALIAEGMLFKIPKGYIYFSMAFAFIVDIIQLRKLGNK